MKAVKMILAGGAALAALAVAAPSSAQNYPGYGASPYGYGNNGYGYGYNGYGNGYGYNGYGSVGMNSQMAIGQCTNAVQARLNGNRGYGNAYGYGGYGGGRVLGISRVEPRSGGGLTVRGVATSGRASGYGYTPNSPVDMTFNCKTDYRGYVAEIDIRPAARSDYGYNNNYTPYNNDYSQYGYRRY